MIKSLAEKYKGYDLAFDSLRGLSLLIVIYHHIHAKNFFGPHAEFIKYQYLFDRRVSITMQIFFVLSGFLLFNTSKRFKGNRIQFVKWFMLRRLFRILPMWWIAMLVFYFFIPTNLENIIINFFLLTSIFIKYDSTVNYTHVGWSLSVEEIFYLFFPWIYSHLRKVSFSLLFLIITLISVVLFRYGLSVNYFSFSGPWIRHFFLINLPSFASGILLSHIMSFNFFHKSNRFIEVFIYIAICISVYYSQGFMPMYLSAFLIVMASQLKDSWFGTFLRSKFLKPAQSIGIMCFSVYLLHLPVFYSVNFIHKRFGIETKGDSIFLIFLSVEVLFFTILISILTFNYIEKRFTLWAREVCGVK